MALTDITGKIKADAEQVVSQIRAEAATTVTEITQQGEIALIDLQRAWTEKQAAAVERERQAVLAQKRQAIQLRIQATKRSMLDEVINLVYKKLQTEPAEQYEARYAAYLQKITLPSALVSVRCAPGREECTKAILQRCGLAHVTPEADETISAGLRLYCADVQYDLSLDRIFADRRSHIEITIAQQLWGELPA